MKRATSTSTFVINALVISIHALVKRATAEVSRSPIKLGYFNPRPREEGDGVKHFIAKGRIAISIHALVKRATSYPTNSRLFHAISIHALVKRATKLFRLA